MIRIRTKWDVYSVITIYYNDQWHTVGHKGTNCVVGYQASNLLEAGQNHLRAALELKSK